MIQWLRALPAPPKNLDLVAYIYMAAQNLSSGPGPVRLSGRQRSTFLPGAFWPGWEEKTLLQGARWMGSITVCKYMVGYERERENSSFPVERGRSKELKTVKSGLRSVDSLPLGPR